MRRKSEDGPPRLAWGMYKRFVLAGVIITSLCAATIASAVLLEIDTGIAIFKRNTTPIDPQVKALLADVAPGKPQTILVIGDDRRKAEALRKHPPPTRSDTMILVRLDPHQRATALMSLPRDLLVDIPGAGRQKINAAYSIGGPKLLTETVENVTGIHIDGYVEIGLGGFASVVDSVGGVHLCVPRDMKDPKAGIDLKKGCQTLDGGDALGYVRSRYEDPLGDIGRAARQRQFLGALMKQAATPATVLLPWRYTAFADASAAGLAVGTETGLTDAVRVLQAMRAVSNDQGLSLSVPTSDLAYRTNAGLAVKWDTERAKALFAALKDDEPLTEPPEGTVPTEPAGN